MKALWKKVVNRIRAALVRPSGTLSRARSGYLFSVGSTGHWPVPSGDPPDGTGGTPAHGALAPEGGIVVIPVGGSPTETGESPGPPPLTFLRHLPFGTRVHFGREIVFQKYRVARRLGTESVRRRLLGRLRVTAALLSGKLEPTG